jgi:hypothetical protein
MWFFFQYWAGTGIGYLKKIHTSLALVLSPRLIFAWCRGGIDLILKGDIYPILSQLLYQMGIGIRMVLHQVIPD